MKTSRLAKTGGIALASSMLLMGALPVASAMAASKPAVTLTGPSDVNQTAGSNVTYTASASNVSNPNYQFWVEEPNGHWMMAQNWSSSNTFTLKNVQDGDYLVTAYVAPKGDWKAATNEQANGQQAVDGVFVDTSITVSAPSTLTAGQPVTITASSANIYDAQYQFWYKTPSGKWMQSGNYGSSSYTFTPTETGSYDFVAYAKSPLALNDPEGAAMSTNSATTTVGVAAPTLSSIAISGQGSGTGTASSPATSTNGKAIMLSTTLMDSSGNPVADTGVTYVFTGSSAPEVSSNGTAVSEVSGTADGNSTYNYTVYTNSTGVASASVTMPTGTSGALTVYATAPFQVNGTTLQTTSDTLEFASGNSALITPATADNVNVGTPVPVTMTLPTTSTGALQSNVGVDFSLPQADSTGVYFTNAAGTADYGTSQTVYTNSAGQATAYVLSSSEASDQTVTATPAVTTISAQTTGNISWGQPGTPSQVDNWTYSGQSGTNSSTGTPASSYYEAQIGSDMTVGGQLVDAEGNPVANASLVVVGSGFGNGTNSYVVNGTPNGFPQVTTEGSSSASKVTLPAATLSGSPLSSTAYGEVIPTDSNGDFSFTITNSTASPIATSGGSSIYGADAYQLYPVVNGNIDTSLPLWSSNPLYVQWTQGTTLTAIGLGVGNQAPSSSATSLTGVSGISGTNIPVSFEGYSGSEDFNSGAVEYTASLTNGATINTVSASGGTALAAQNTVIPSDGLSSITVEATPNHPGISGTTYTIAVNGTNINTTATSSQVTLGVGSSSAGSTKLTINGDGLTSTAALSFSSNGVPSSSYTSVSPDYSALSAGQSQVYTYTVEDSSGNPVGNTSIQFEYGTSGTGLFVTAVNGKELQTSNSTYGTEATPIPLFDMTSVPPLTSNTTDGQDLGYSSVTMPGVVSWSNPTSASGTINVETNSSGVFSLTLTAGGANAAFFNGNASNGAYTGTVSTSQTTYSGVYNSASSNYLTFNGTSTGSIGQVSW